MPIRRPSNVALAVALVALAALVAPRSPAGAQTSSTIPIVNAGFEEAPLADGQFRNFAFGWTRGGTGLAGVLNPPPGAYPPTGAVLEGQNVAFLSGNASLTQTLPAVLEANTAYDISAVIGHRADVSANDWFIELLVGGTHLVGDNGGRSTPPPGTFTARGLTLIPPVSPSDPRLGQPLSIRLSTIGAGQTNFDRVFVTKTVFEDGGVVATLVNPEPGTVALLAGGLLAIGGAAGLRRRRPQR